MPPPTHSRRGTGQKLVCALLALYCIGLLYYLAALWVVRVRAAAARWDMPAPSYRLATSRSALGQGRVLVVQDNCLDGCGTHVFIEDPPGKFQTVSEYNSEISHVLNALCWSKDRTVFAARSSLEMGQPKLGAIYDFTQHRFASGDTKQLLAQHGGLDAPFYDGDLSGNDAQWAALSEWKALSAQQFAAMKNSAS